MVQRIKTGMIADDAVTAAKLSSDADNISVFRNRIINGAMVIDQRNAGASVTGVSGTYLVDRFVIQNNSGESRFSGQQNAGSVTPPIGFTNYLGLTSTSAYSVGATDVIGVTQFIEGFNIADLGWGTANAKTITLSAWVRSSLTGTFGGSLSEGNAGTAFYPFSYSIHVANTWTQISVTIAGPTIGTWQTTNSRGIQVLFSLGTGSTFSGTVGSWSASSFYSASGATSVVGTDGATFYITGVQLEVGTQATSFEYRQYQQELALCQRYYWQQGGGQYERLGNGIGNVTAGSNFQTSAKCPVEMRTIPSVSTVSIGNTGFAGIALSSISIDTAGSSRLLAQLAASLASGGLTTGYAYNWETNNSTAPRVQYSAEL